MERSTEKPVDQALQAQTSKKGGYNNKGVHRDRGRGKDCKTGNNRGSQYSDQEKSNQDQGESSRR